MRSALIILAVGLAAPTAVASPSPSAPSLRAERGARPRPATEAELEGYAEREQRASKLAGFEGGRRGAIATSTVIIILLVAILVVLII